MTCALTHSCWGTMEKEKYIQWYDPRDMQKFRCTCTKIKRQAQLKIFWRYPGSSMQKSMEKWTGCPPDGSRVTNDKILILDPNALQDYKYDFVVNLMNEVFIAREKLVGIQ